MKQLSGRVALLTGASRGIGTTIAETLALRGMDLVLAARSAEALEKLAAKLRSDGRRVLCFPVDLGDRDALGRLVDAAIAFGNGGVDVLVNNAGLEQNEPYEKVAVDTLDRVLEVNLRAPMILAHGLLPSMIERGRGHIVNVSSVSGLMGTPFNESYSASKHGLLGFTRSLRLSLEAEGHPVGVSSVCPGFVTDAGMYADGQAEIGMQAPAHMGSSTPRQVADAIVAAIESNHPEVVVNSIPLRPVAVAGLAFPRVGEWLLGRMGVVDLFRKSAWERVRQRERATPES